MIKSFLDLNVYQESFQLSLEIDRLVKILPRNEQYLLGDQMKRASRGIPALIAEGYAKRETLQVFRKLLGDAIGEANEMINHLAFAKVKKYLKPEKADELIEKYHVVGNEVIPLKRELEKLLIPLHISVSSFSFPTSHFRFIFRKISTNIH